MNDHDSLEARLDRVEQLMATEKAEREAQASELATLKCQRATDDAAKTGAFDALRSTQERVMHLQQRVTTALPPEITAAREEGLLPKFAALATRTRAVEEWLLDLTNVILRDLGELKDMLQRW